MVSTVAEATGLAASMTFVLCSAAVY